MSFVSIKSVQYGAFVNVTLYMISRIINRVIKGFYCNLVCKFGRMEIFLSCKYILIVTIDRYITTLPPKYLYLFCFNFHPSNSFSVNQSTLYLDFP